MAKSQPLSKVQNIIIEYSKYHQSSVNKYLQWFCIPLISFGILGVIWSIPFPQLDFLGKYNGFVNWASFVIAFYVFYYYRLSPLASYIMLLVVFAFSAGIVSLEKLHNNQGWPLMGEVCFFLLLLGLFIQFIGYKKEGIFPPSSIMFKSILFGPIWLMRRLFKNK